jgi:hypothetical protein
MSKQRLNIELFKKIRDRIAAIPAAYDQSIYFRPDDNAPCGTAACLAGEAIICSAPSVEAGVEALRYHDSREGVPEVAADLLGLPPAQWGDGFPEQYNETARLFAFIATTKCFGPNHSRATFAMRTTQRARAAVAVKYLNHIIETGKVLE